MAVSIRFEDQKGKFSAEYLNPEQLKSFFDLDFVPQWFENEANEINVVFENLQLGLGQLLSLISSPKY